VLVFGAAPVKTAVPAGILHIRLGLAICRKGPAMKSTGAFLFGFMAASTPIFIYIAWVTWRIG
jgi:hypothetical protein